MHYSSAMPVRIFYFLTSLWHGVLVNIWVLMFFSGLVMLVLRMFIGQVEPANLQRIALLSLFIAVLLSIYGVYNVFNLKTHIIDLSLKNLPVEWQGRKAAFITDVHLGSILREGHMQRITKALAAAQPDIIFITGDLFDSIDGSAELFQAILKDLDAPLGVYYVSGNHEMYLGMSKSEEILSGTKIRILDDQMVEIDGLQIVGLAYPLRSKNKNIAERLAEIKNFDPEKNNILLYHEPIAIDQAKQAGFDLMLAGHTHCGQIWPFNFITNAIFKGYDYGFFKEGDFQLYTSSGAGVWGPTMRTSGRSEVVVFNFK